MEGQIISAKENFLNRFNPGRTVHDALNKAVNRSVQRANVYTPGLTQRRKAEIRKYWKEQLREMGEKYVEIQPFEIFELDMIELQKRMNEMFHEEFCHPFCSLCSGFRIAQAQKSLSLYLKHLWCVGLIPVPPVCPVDSIILGTTAISAEFRNWVCICTLEEYYIRLNAIRAAAGDMNVAEWELLNY